MWHPPCCLDCQGQTTPPPPPPQLSPICPHLNGRPLLPQWPPRGGSSRPPVRLSDRSSPVRESLGRSSEGAPSCRWPGLPTMYFSNLCGGNELTNVLIYSTATSRDVSVATQKYNVESTHPILRDMGATSCIGLSAGCSST